MIALDKIRGQRIKGYRQQCSPLQPVDPGDCKLYSGFMKKRTLLLLSLVFLTGCSFVFNQPIVGPNGTIAFFLDNEGAYSLLPEGEGKLTLLREGRVVRLEGVISTGDSGVLDWSVDGKELIFIETETGEWGSMPIAFNLCITGVQTDSHPVTLFHLEDLILAPAFTPEGEITYLQFGDDDEAPQLFLYDREENVHTQLLADVLSYRPIRPGSKLIVIQASAEGEVRLARVSTYDPTTGTVEEVASFFLAKEMEETFFLPLVLYDQVLITPTVEAEDRAPSLYLIDRADETGKLIADMGLIPAFSPDGSLLAYIGSNDGQTPFIYLYHLETGERHYLDGTTGVSTIFWIDEETLGFTIEADEGTYQLMKVSLDTEEVTPLLP
jgi:Tol biopolymer transport system component